MGVAWGRRMRVVHGFLAAEVPAKILIIPALAAALVILSAAPGHAQARDVLSLTGINDAIGVTSAQAPVHKASFNDDGDIAALRAFAAGLTTPAASARPDQDGADGDAEDSALRLYADGLATEPGRVRVAEADNLLDAIRGMMKKNAAPATTTAPAAPAAPRAQTPATKAVKPAAAHDATFVGMKTCLGCHAAQAASFGDTLMGRIGKTHQGKFDCENCHGPGSEHAKAGGGRGVGGIISFRKDDDTRTTAENNAICLGCHERGERTYWSGSTHDQRDVACTECHTVMRKVSPKFNLKTAFEPDTCFQCHKDRRAQMYRSAHMPVREGKMVCSDCHNPHGSFTEALLRENSINDNCYKCHAEKRGPFLFEHAPVRENCLNCHDPHGSVN